MRSGTLQPFLPCRCIWGVVTSGCALCTQHCLYALYRDWMVDVEERLELGVQCTFRVAVFPPVLGPVMMTLRSSGRTQMLIGTGGRLLSRSSDSLSLPSASESPCSGGPEHTCHFAKLWLCFPTHQTHIHQLLPSHLLEGR